MEDTESVNTLLLYGAIVQVTNKMKQTPFMLASHHPKIASLLLAHGADRTATDKFGYDAEYYARIKDSIGLSYIWHC